MGRPRIFIGLNFPPNALVDDLITEYYTPYDLQCHPTSLITWSSNAGDYISISDFPDMSYAATYSPATSPFIATQSFSLTSSNQYYVMITNPDFNLSSQTASFTYSITLIQLDGAMTNGGVLAEWVNAYSNINLEVSADGNSYSLQGDFFTVSPPDTNYYGVISANLFDGYFYRVSTTDINGNYTYSNATQSVTTTITLDFVSGSGIQTTYHNAFGTRVIYLESSPDNITYRMQTAHIIDSPDESHTFPGFFDWPGQYSRVKLSGVGTDIYSNVLQSDLMPSISLYSLVDNGDGTATWLGTVSNGSSYNTIYTQVSLDGDIFTSSGSQSNVSDGLVNQTISNGTWSGTIIGRLNLVDEFGVKYYSETQSVSFSTIPPTVSLDNINDLGDGRSTYTYTVTGGQNNNTVEFLYSFNNGVGNYIGTNTLSNPNGLLSNQPDGQQTITLPNIGSGPISVAMQYFINGNYIMLSGWIGITWSATPYSIILNSVVDNGDHTSTYNYTTSGLSGSDETVCGPNIVYSSPKYYNLNTSIIESNLGNGTYEYTLGNPNPGTQSVFLLLVEPAGTNSGYAISNTMSVAWS